MRICSFTFFGHAEGENKLSEKKTSFPEFNLEYLLHTTQGIESLLTTHSHYSSTIFPLSLSLYIQIFGPLRRESG